MSYVTHCFLPGHTLEGIIRRVVRHDLPKDQLALYVERFNELNDYPVIRPGVSYKVPTGLVVVDGEGSDLD
jgi:hypothetical protein